MKDKYMTVFTFREETPKEERKEDTVKKIIMCKIEDYNCYGLQWFTTSMVYKYKCNRYNSVYVGKTSRHLPTRIAEHLGISFRTGKSLSNFHSVKYQNTTKNIIQVKNQKK